MKKIFVIFQLLLFIFVVGGNYCMADSYDARGEYYYNDGGLKIDKRRDYYAQDSVLKYDNVQKEKKSSKKKNNKNK